jgi:hypothetical protein
MLLDADSGNLLNATKFNALASLKSAYAIRTFLPLSFGEGVGGEVYLRVPTKNIN